MKPFYSLALAVAFGGAAVGAVLLTGCASSEVSSSKPRPGSGIAEYREMATDARASLNATRRVLEQLQSQSGPCPPGLLATFAKEVNDLQVESVQIRARAQVMHERGDAWFANWHEHIATVKDPAVRTLVEQHRADLEAAFQRIKALAGQGRESFQPFIARLRDLRNTLEQSPDSLTQSATRDTLRAAGDLGAGVDRQLAGIVHELDAMQLLVTPMKKVSAR